MTSGCPALSSDSKTPSFQQAVTPKDAADAVRTSGGIPSNTAAVSAGKQFQGIGDHRTEAQVQANHQKTETILDASNISHGGEENDMSDYKGAMDGTGPHATYK